MKESRRWSSALATAALVALTALVAAGCGGGNSDEAQIRELLADYYEQPAAGQCRSLTTEQFRSAVYGGSGDGALTACEDHQRTRRKLPQIERTAFVDHVRVEDDQATAEIRGGGITLTERLVRSGDGWLLSDEASPFHRSANATDLGGGAEEGEPQAFGTPAAFTNIPNVSGPMAITLVAREPIDPGLERSGAKRAVGRIGSSFGQPGPVRRLRFVNLPITLINTGSRPFRGDIGLFATDRHGREFTPLDRREITQQGNIFGRPPDWAVGEAKGIPPNAEVTRYLTIALPVGDRIVEWRLTPNMLTGPSTLSSMEPLEGVTYRAASGARA